MVQPVDSFPSIPDAFLALADAEPHAIVYRQAARSETAGISWVTANYLQVRHRVQAFAHFLVQSGLKPGDRVAILSNTRPEWLEADLGILLAGGVSVSVYQTLTAEEVGYILFDSGASLVVVENEEQLKKILYLIANEVRIPGTEERSEILTRLNIQRIVSIEKTSPNELVSHWADIIAEPAPTNTRFPQLQSNDLAALVYTSGTTGPPKGVIQSHANHLANVRQAHDGEIYEEDTSFFLLLPLAHSFAKLIGYIGFLTKAHLAFPEIPNRQSSKTDPVRTMQDLVAADVDVIPLVPRILEKMRDALVDRSSKSSLISKLLARMLKASKARFKAAAEGQKFNLRDRIWYFLTAPLRILVKRKLFGRKFKFIVSGGAKLPVDVAEFFESLGVLVLEGYGLTETCVATNVNRRHRRRIGTVGPVLSPDIEIKIALDGEILYRGPNITSGYYGRISATKASWDSEGWFHTGDIGSLDDSGFLKITGRKKELIVLSNGKKIAPDYIEHKILASNFISQAVLLGESKAHCSALITLNRGAVLAWAAGQKITLHENIEADQRVIDLIGHEIQGINNSLANYEQVRRFKILAEEFSIDNGLLTPTLKIKRAEVMRRYRDVADELLGQS